MQANRKSPKNKYKIFPTKVWNKNSWTSHLNVVSMNALPVQVGYQPVAEPGHPPIALQLPGCVSIVARSHQKSCQSYESRKKSVLSKSPLRRVDHSLLPVEDLHLSVPVPLSDTIDEHNLEEVVAELQCEDNEKQSYIFVLKLFFCSFESYCYRTPSLLKDWSPIHWSPHWIASSFISLSPLCL